MSDAGELVLHPAEPDDLDAILALEGLSAATSNDFIFDSLEQSTALRRLLLERGAGEYALPFCRVLREEGRTVGFIAVLGSDDLKKQRLRAALLLRREGSRLLSPEALERMNRVSAALVPVLPDDAYFARMAVLPDHAGRGLGRWLQEQAIEWGRSLGAARLLYDVVETNVNPLAMYRRRGCEEVGRAVAEDPTSGSRLGFVHLALPLR